MSMELSTEEREMQIKDLFLKIFQEEGVSLKELKEAICESYIAEGFDCKEFDDIPLKEMETAILDCYQAGGLEFNNIEEAIEYNRNKKED